MNIDRVPQATDGCLDLDTRPGLGVELDWKAVQRLAYQPAPGAVTTAGG